MSREATHKVDCQCTQCTNLRERVQRSLAGSDGRVTFESIMGFVRNPNRGSLSSHRIYSQDE